MKIQEFLDLRTRKRFFFSSQTLEYSLIPIHISVLQTNKGSQIRKVTMLGLPNLRPFFVEEWAQSRNGMRQLPHRHCLKGTGPCLNMIAFSGLRISIVNIRPYCIYNGNPYTGKTVSFLSRPPLVVSKSNIENLLSTKDIPVHLLMVEWWMGEFSDWSWIAHSFCEWVFSFAIKQYRFHWIE